MKQKHHRANRDTDADRRSNPPTAGLQSMSHVVVGILTTVFVVLLAMWLIPGQRTAGPTARSERSAASAPSPWTVGTLRSDGLRIIVSGREGASAVLDPKQFSEPEVRHGYWIATQIPTVLNKLYCWCGCENRGEHRSNLQCFEDQMAADCRVCLGTAETAFEMSQKGVTDAAKIQAAVDAVWQPK